MPCRHPCRLYIHLAFTYSVGPSSVVWSKLGLAPPFPPMRVLEVQWSWALSPVCEVAFTNNFFVLRATSSHMSPRAMTLVMVRTLDSHPKAVPWVLGKVILRSHGPSSIVWSENGPCYGTVVLLCWQEKKGGFGFIWYVANSINLRESLGGVCLSWNLLSNLPCCLSRNLSCWKKYIYQKKSWCPRICDKPTSWRWGWQNFRETMRPYL